MGRSFRKISYVLIPFLAYYVVHDVVRVLIMFGLQKISGHSAAVYTFIRKNDAICSGIISAVDLIIGALVLIFIMRTDREELSVWDYVNLNGLSFYRKDRMHPAFFSWILLTVQAVSMAIGLNILIGLTGIIRISSYSSETQAQFALPMWFGILLYGFLSPGVEELLFRTIFYGRMKRRFSYIISVIVSSMFFGLYHGNVVQGVYGFIMGILMCLACEYVHSVAGAFLMHSAANLTIYLLGSRNVLSILGTPGYCALFLGIGIASIAAQVTFGILSERRFGRIEGIIPVGLFYKDPTLFEDDGDEDHEPENTR